jgi:hypothetical protein
MPLEMMTNPYLQQTKEDDDNNDDAINPHTNSVINQPEQIGRNLTE